MDTIVDPKLQTSAKIIADSINEDSSRIVTMEVVFHRFVLSEANTHRTWSRNSASSRAIPVSKQLDRVKHNTAFPLVWPKEQKGMQGGESLSEDDIKEANEIWIDAADDACIIAHDLAAVGVHKSVVNRLLEPFMWHTAVITATAFQNFFNQRCSPLAQPEIRAVAELMQKAYAESKPQWLGENMWHLPYIQNDEFRDHPYSLLKKVSAARCARVSYLTQDGKRDIEEDVRLYERLVSANPMHASPLEHVAKPALNNVHRVNPTGKFELVLPKYGNVLGWHQLRFDVEANQQYQSFS